MQRWSSSARSTTAVRPLGVRYSALGMLSVVPCLILLHFGVLTCCSRCRGHHPALEDNELGGNPSISRLSSWCSGLNCLKQRHNAALGAQARRMARKRIRMRWRGRCWSTGTSPPSANRPWRPSRYALPPHPLACRCAAPGLRIVDGSNVWHICSAHCFDAFPPAADVCRCRWHPCGYPHPFILPYTMTARQPVT